MGGGNDSKHLSSSQNQLETEGGLLSAFCINVLAILVGLQPKTAFAVCYCTKTHFWGVSVCAATSVLY